MPLSPTATRDLLASLGHSPKRFLGQNFLVDGNIVRKSVELAQVSAGDHVVEIGPGLGTLTSALLETGAHVWAVEKDRVLHAHLASTLVKKFPLTFHLLEGDALDYPLAGLEGQRPGLEKARGNALDNKMIMNQALEGRRKQSSGTLDEAPLQGLDNLSSHTRGVAPGYFEPGCQPSTPHTAIRNPQSFKIVANLPYAISTPWMDAVLSGPLPGRMVLMLQQEAAQRHTAVPGTKQYSAISIFLQSAFDMAPGHKVSAACFYPRPDIESCLLHLVRKPAPFMFAPETKALIRACFQQRRKQLGALLRGRLPAAARDAWFARLAAAGLAPQARPEDVPVALWAHFPESGIGK